MGVAFFDGGWTIHTGLICIVPEALSRGLRLGTASRLGTKEISEGEHAALAHMIAAKIFFVARLAVTSAGISCSDARFKIAYPSQSASRPRPQSCARICHVTARVNGSAIPSV